MVNQPFVTDTETACRVFLWAPCEQFNEKKPVRYLRGILMAVHLQGVHEKSCDKHHTWGLLQSFLAILFSKSFRQPLTSLLHQKQRFNFKNLPLQGCKLGL